MAIATYLFDFLNNQYEHLRGSSQIFQNKASNNRVAVIIEPRHNHPLLLKIIRNVMYFVGDKWNLHIFTSASNITWIKRELDGSIFRMTPFDKENMTRDEYSALLMSSEFWNMIPEENILIFQTDAMLFRKGIDKWIDDPDYGYDYVGANYYNPSHIAPIIQGIQGGLSLRKKAAMLDCIKHIDIGKIQRYRFNLGYDYLRERVIAEDVFFTHACEILKKRVPSVEKRREFSIEADYYPHAIGHHGLTHAYLTEEQQKELLSSA